MANSYWRDNRSLDGWRQGTPEFSLMLEMEPHRFISIEAAIALRIAINGEVPTRDSAPKRAA